MLKEFLSGENNKIEYKVEIPAKSEQYIKTVIAFANGNGGKIIFGVDDTTRKVIGIREAVVFDKMDAVTNAIYDSCEPKILPDISIQEFNGKKVIVVNISKGMQCPYYIKRLGIMEGTFIRVAGTTRRAQHYQLQELLLRGKNRSFDQQIVSEPVDVDRIDKFCEKLYSYAFKSKFGDSDKSTIKKITLNQLISWKLIEQKGNQYFPTNAFLLLEGYPGIFSDFTIQCAVFKGVTRSVL